MLSVYRWSRGILEKWRDLPKVVEKVSGDNKESLLRQKPLTGYQEEVKAGLRRGGDGDLIPLPSPESY